MAAKAAAAAATSVDPTSNLEKPNEVNEEVLNKFQRITGITNTEANISILSKNKWDLESALREQIEKLKYASLNKPSLERLTQEQKEKILEFQRLTGIWDPLYCINILVQHKWSVSAAIETQFRKGFPEAYPDEPRPIDRVVNVITGTFDAIVYYTYNFFATIVEYIAWIFGADERKI